MLVGVIGGKTTLKPVFLYSREVAEIFGRAAGAEPVVRPGRDLLPPVRARLPEQDGQDCLLGVGQHREVGRLRLDQLPPFRQ